MTEPTRNKLSVAAILGFLVCGILLMMSAFAAANHASMGATVNEISPAGR